MRNEARSAPGPLYRRIADILRQEIERGALIAGEAMPTEQELVRRFGVSRGTIRQARAALRSEGVIGGSQGRVFSVRGAPLTQPLGELISFTSWAQRLGRKPGARVIHFGSETADHAAAVALGLDAGVSVCRLERIRTIDGQPVMIERTIFPIAIGELLATVDLTQESVYAVLASRGIVPATARHRIEATPANGNDAALLGIARGSPLLRVERLGFDRNQRPLEWSIDSYRGDRANFEIENSAAAPVLARRLDEGAS
jgi:GntR family transcriptional regulator